MDENPHDVLHGTKWTMFYGLLDIALGPLKRGRSKPKLWVLTINYIVFGSYKYYIATVGLGRIEPIKYGAVPRHVPISLYIKL
jgi:hypothetical protein